MIKRLRIRFIGITMISVIVVLGIIIALINFVNYHNVRVYADDILNILSDNDGQFQPQEPNRQPPQGQKPENGNAETPFETRYFTVTIYSGGDAEANTAQIAAVNSEQAIQLAEKVIGHTRGYQGIYRYKVTQKEDKTLVIFVDCSRQLSTAEGFLWSSIIISASGVLAVFLLVVLLSKRAVLPIAESYKRQKIFITNAGHELKTPLTIISANNEMLELEYGENEYTEAISKQIGKMTNMVKKLVVLAKLDEETELKEKKSFSLTDALSDVILMYEPLFASKGKQLSSKTVEGITMNGNEALIRQLFQIILDNSLKYTLSHAKIQLKKESGKIIIQLENDAEGIPPGDLSRCFDRFYRTDEARASDIEGSGIGLSVAKEIVKLHQGEITASGLDNHIFSIYIAFKA